MQILVYELGPVDWYPFEFMERKQALAKRLEEQSEYGPHNRKAILEALVMSCMEYTDEIKDTDEPWVFIAPYNKMAICFNNVHKGSAIIASTFDLSHIIPEEDIEDRTFYYAVPELYRIKKG